MTSPYYEPPAKPRDEAPQSVSAADGPARGDGFWSAPAKPASAFRSSVGGVFAAFARPGLVGGRVELIDPVEGEFELRIERRHGVSFLPARETLPGPAPAGHSPTREAYEARLDVLCDQARGEAWRMLREWAELPTSGLYAEPGQSRYARLTTRAAWQWTCEGCSGKGNVGCGACGTKGRVTCSRCSGEGRSSCSACAGSARLRCARCSGSGTLTELELGPIPEPFAKSSFNRRPFGYACPTCHGSGYLACTSCYSGTVACSSCGESGTVRCSDCAGSGRQSCRSCRATGKRHEMALVEASPIVETFETFVGAVDADRVAIKPLPYSKYHELCQFRRVGVSEANFRLVLAFSGRVRRQGVTVRVGEQRKPLFAWGECLHVPSYLHVLDLVLEPDLVNLERAVSGKAWGEGGARRAVRVFRESPLHDAIAARTTPLGDAEASPEGARDGVVVAALQNGLVSEEHVARGERALARFASGILGARLRRAFTKVALCGLGAMVVPFLIPSAWLEAAMHWFERLSVSRPQWKPLRPLANLYVRGGLGLAVLTLSLIVWAIVRWGVTKRGASGEDGELVRLFGTNGGVAESNRRSGLVIMLAITWGLGMGAWYALLSNS